MSSRSLDKPLESQRQSYYLNQKNLIIHSNDRNEKIWPDANNFEVTIPNAYKNVQSIRLSNIILPRHTEQTFSVNNKNTKFDMCYNTTSKATIEIDEGEYTVPQMTNMLKNKIDDAFTLGNSSTFDVCYNEVSKKLIMTSGSSTVGFDLKFGEKPEYSSNTINQSSRIDVFNKLNNWGLGSFLGFKRETYSSAAAPTGGISLNYLPSHPTIVAATNHYIEAPFELRLDNTENEVFYVEIDHLNQFDEVTPDKITDIVFTTNEVDQHTTSFFSEVVQLQGKGPANSGSGVSHFNPPLDYLNKLKFKFRHHDYSLVDFRNRDFTIILQITYLEPDPFKVGRIRKPEFYEK